jgi:hypothetical protein
MEILELVFGLGEGCGCFLELLTLTADVGAGVAGMKARKKRKERRAAQEAGAAAEPAGPLAFPEGQTRPAPAHDRSTGVFLVLLVLGLILTGLTLWKWLR